MEQNTTSQTPPAPVAPPPAPVAAPPIAAPPMAAPPMEDGGAVVSKSGGIKGWFNDINILAPRNIH